MSEDAGPKELALREMRETRLKQVMKADQNNAASKLRDSETKPRGPRPKVKGYGRAARPAQPPAGKRKLNKGTKP